MCGTRRASCRRPNTRGSFAVRDAPRRIIFLSRRIISCLYICFTLARAVLQKGEEQTGVHIRVLTRSRSSDESTYDPRAIKSWLGPDAGNNLLVLADRGIPGALESGSAYLTFSVGQNIQLALPDVFFARLKQEYGRRSFVEARGEAASIIVACELILTCLRSEEGYCTTVPPASSSAF